MGGARWLGGRALDSESRCPCSSIIKGAVVCSRARRIHFPQALGYALVICNHGPHPWGRAGGGSCGNEQGFDQSYATVVREKKRGLLYIGKQCRENVK